MPDYDIAFRRGDNKDIRLPDSLGLVSLDRGVVHAKFKDNGMHLVVIPTGKTGSAMMRRVCVGGSRLEDASCAGAAHVIEHMDFRNLDWLDFGGMTKNAATSKLYIMHEAYMLLDPTSKHVEKELRFQRQTMLGENLKGLTDQQILHEINNVRDEGRFNSQKGAGFRAVVMEMERMMLPRVWSDNANVEPTIGTDYGLSNLKTETDIVRMHNMFRAPQRTFMVVAGPVNVNKTLQVMHDTFHDIPFRHDAILRDIPVSVTPEPRPAQFSSISLDSGNRFVAIGGVHGAYSADTDVMQVMQHLVGLLGSQPIVQQNGLKEVVLYFEPSKETGVFSVVAQVTPEGDETTAVARAHEVLQQCVINPLLKFSDNAVLQTLLNQYCSSLHEALQSGPQQCATLAVQGILACEKPSLAWHVNDRFNINQINAQRIRQVASKMFDPRLLGIVHCTAHKAQKPSMQIIQVMPEERQHTVKINLSPDTSHLQSDIEAFMQCKYLDLKQKKMDLHVQEDVLTHARDLVGKIAYNTISVQPTSKRSLVCSLGTPAEYGGWAQASMAVAAMNIAAKIAHCPMVKFKLDNQSVTCTVESNDTQPFLTKPLLATLALGLALGDLSVSTPELDQLRQIVPQQALQLALDTAKKWYNDPSQLAMAQARSQMCTVVDAGFVPHNMTVATQLLGAEHQFLHKYLPTLCKHAPHLAGTNISRTHLHQIAQQIHQMQQKMPEMPSHISEEDAITIDQTFPQVQLLTKHVEGLHTFPYVASQLATKALDRKDRAALLVSNQIMVGGMGAHFTHDIRQRGVSYRPSGGIQLSWQDRPVLLLKATFKDSVLDTGRDVTKQNLSNWATGASNVFTPAKVHEAKQAIKEQVLLTSMDFDAQKYSLLACLDPQKFSMSEILHAVDSVKSTTITRTLRNYFAPTALIYESIVQDD